MEVIASIMTQKPEMWHTRTYEDYSKFLGSNPKRLGILARMEPYAQMTASYLTEGMGNVMTNKADAGSKYQKIDALSFSWEVEQNNIEYVEFAEDVVENGVNGSEITMVFDRKYYGTDDTFIIEGSKQMCYVLDEPTRKADRYWCYQVRLMDSDRQALLATSACHKGDRTRWIGNVKPELHETGNVKYQSNAQQLKQWISEIRVQLDYSHRYEALEKTFVKLSKGSDANGWTSKIFEWPEKKKLLMDNFMASRNQGMLWQRGTMDENGKSTVYDRQGRPIIAGDGIIRQIEKFASKFSFSKLSVSQLNDIVLDLSQKAISPTGNTFICVCNERLFAELQKTLSEFLFKHRTDAAYIWSKQSNGYIKVGASYNAYEFMQNTVILKVDRALSIEYSDRGYGVFIDLTADKATGRPAIEKFQLEGRELIDNTLKGVGSTNGEVATAVAGSMMTLTGTWGVGVYSPFRSAILVENR